MGQYHITVSLDQKEFINPHRLGDGLKLWEQGASQGGTLNALHALLVVSNGRGGGDYIGGHGEFVGRWAGDRVAVIGDYTGAEDLEGVEGVEYIWDACWAKSDEDAGERELGPFKPGEWTDISDMARAFLAEQWQLEFGDDGWVDRTCLPGSPFEEGAPRMMPDMIVGPIGEGES